MSNQYAVIRIDLEPVSEYDVESDEEMDALADKLDELVSSLEDILPQLDKDFHFNVSAY